MEVILLEKVENLGSLGDIVNVKPGYGRNFLIPSGKATVASEANKADFEQRRAELEKVAQERLSTAQARAQSLEGKTLNLSVKAGTEGKLFGSIGVVDVVKGLAAEGVEVERHEVRMPQGPIRMIGEHQVQLHLHTDVDVDLMLNVQGEE